MPAKSTSPEAAQKKVWKAERKALGRAYCKILNDALRASAQAVKKRDAALREYDATIKRIDREVPKATRKIEQRIAILDGRIGV